MEIWLVSPRGRRGPVTGMTAATTWRFGCKNKIVFKIVLSNLSIQNRSSENPKSKYKQKPTFTKNFLFYSKDLHLLILFNFIFYSIQNYLFKFSKNFLFYSKYLHLLIIFNFIFYSIQIF